MALQERSDALAASTAAQMSVLYAALLAGGLTPAEATAAMAAAVNAANAAATTLADVFVSAQVEMAAGVPSPPTGVAPRDEFARLSQAVSTVLDDQDADTAGMRLERLARSEPLDTGQAAAEEIVTRLPAVTGWTRVLDADPCERCRRWAEGGRVFPKDHHFKRHHGCKCQMQIVTREGKPA